MYSLQGNLLEAAREFCWKDHGTVALATLSMESLAEHCSLSGSITNLRRDSCSCVDNSSSEKCTELLHSLRQVFTTLLSREDGGIN